MSASPELTKRAAAFITDRDPFGDHFSAHDLAQLDPAGGYTDSERRKAEQRIQALGAAMLAALEALVNQLEVCHNDERFRSVWVLSHLHIGPYSGPKYESELEAAKAAIAKARGGSQALRRA